MFQRLQKKWKVNGLQLALIICTFAIGGSLTGLAGKKLMNFLPVEKGWLWVILYIIIITLLWPVFVIMISIFFGQYRFFTKYLEKIGRRMGLMSPESKVGSHELKKNEHLEIAHKQSTINNPATTHLAIFASGAGSNAQKIIDHFRHSGHIKISLIVCNKPGAGVLAIAEKENIPALLIDKEQFFRGDAYTAELKERKIDFIVLAGFLWKIPIALIKAYHGNIINLHPALLPKYGGKGMYGNHVHEAVISAKEKESGITIHYVDEHYDHGDAIFQAYCDVLENDTPGSLAQRIHQLEHQHYPPVIEKLLTKELK